MSGKLTPQELEAQRQKLLGSARAEKADPAKTAAGLDALLAGEVKPLGIEPPALGGRKKPWWLLGVGVLALAVLWWLLNGRGNAVEVSPPQVVDAGVFDVGGPAVDAGALELAGAVDAGTVEFSGVVDQSSRRVDAGTPAPALEVDAGVTSKPTRVVEEVDTLAAELKLLDEARGALKADPGRTLAVLDRYAKKFPRGSLELEASLVRVEALFALGRRAEGQKLVEKLRKRDSGGLLKERLERLEAQP